MTPEELDDCRVAYRLAFDDDAAEAVAIALRHGPGTFAWAAVETMVALAPPTTYEDNRHGF